MRRTVGESIGVKASGGVRTLYVLRQMVAAGANRIGTSSGVHVLRELQAGALNTQGSSSATGQY